MAENRRILDYIKGLDQDKVIFVGSRTSFFFIGPARIFAEKYDEIEKAEKKKAPRPTRYDNDTDYKYVPIKDRRIKDTYERIENDGHVIILEGRESGNYWFEHEYAKANPDILSSIV